MHAIGGLYLDIDVECFTSTDHLLDGREIILQLETEDAKSLNNAVMASVPGHPFWMAVIQLLVARGSQANVNNIYPWLGFLGFKDLGTVLQSTGNFLATRQS